MAQRSLVSFGKGRHRCAPHWSDGTGRRRGSVEVQVRNGESGGRCLTPSKCTDLGVLSVSLCFCRALSVALSRSLALSLKCSQPLVGVTMVTSKDDEKVMKYLASTSTKECHSIIFDARPLLSAQGNHVRGGGMRKVPIIPTPPWNF